ncbi:MAG: AMP-binding protein [Actinomycetota bacterium]|nr:AMP-binding protein [Actinomycetota bacterium]
MHIGLPGRAGCGATVAVQEPVSERGEPRMIEGMVPYPEPVAAEYRARGYWEDRTLWSVYAESFERHATRVALLSGDEEVTYAEVAARATRLAAGLRRVGLRPGDRIVVQLVNEPAFLYLYFACQRLGVVPLLALPPHREHEIGHYVEFVGAVAYAVSSGTSRFDFVGFAREVQARHPGLRHVLVSGRGAPDDLVSIDAMLREEVEVSAEEVAALDAVEVDPGDPCCLLLSGGTTGIPNVIARTHNDYVYNARVSAEVNGVDGDSRVVACLPLAHNYPLNAGVLASWLHGGAVVLAPTPGAADALPLVERHRATHVEAVPAVWITWLNDPVLSTLDVSSVRVVNSAAQKLQPEICARLETTFPNAVVQEIFGMTEGLLFMNRLDDPPEARRETVGTPISEADEVRLVDEDGDDVAPGEVGELLCRGPYTLRGYFSAPEVNARMFTSDGYYRSGDLLRRHPSGGYVVEGRKKDLVNRGGEKISVEEVEDMLLAHLAVRNVACVPMPDEVLGERMCAFVVPAGDAPSLAQLCDFLEQRGLARFKWPERLEVVEDLPLSNIGKVQKNVLAARAAELVKARVS